MPEPQPDSLVPAPAVEITAEAVLPPPGPDDAGGRGRRAKAKKGWGILFWLSAGWLVLVTVLAVGASWIPGLADPTETGLGPARQPPSAQHIFGLDTLGRDMLSRTIYAGRVSLAVGFASIAAGLIVGGAIGVLAGYFRGRFETVVMGAMDVLLAFPALVLAIAVVTFLGPTLRTVTLAISILSIAPIARVIRATTLTFSGREFVLAARTLGAKNRRIIMSEILPNVIPAAVSFALVAVAVAIVAEGALSFLGLSVRPPTPTWGAMINDGRTYLDVPHLSFIPSGALFLTVLALNFVGDSLSSRFDVREGRL